MSLLAAAFIKGNLSNCEIAVIRFTNSVRANIKTRLEDLDRRQALGEDLSGDIKLLSEAGKIFEQSLIANESEEFIESMLHLCMFLMAKELPIKAVEDLIKQAKSEQARNSAEKRHSAPNGSRSKKEEIIQIWQSGKYSSREVCAEQECGALGVSFSKARRDLTNTADPNPWPAKLTKPA